MSYSYDSDNDGYDDPSFSNSSSCEEDGCDYEPGELCTNCDDQPASPYFQLADGCFYCADCYESQK